MSANPTHLRIWLPVRAEKRSDAHWLACYRRHVKYTHHNQEQENCPACKELREKAGI